MCTLNDSSGYSCATRCSSDDERGACITATILVLHIKEIYFSLSCDLSCDLTIMTAMVGQVEERGRFLGRMKLALDGFTPYSFVMLGDEKSSISLLRMIPVLVISLEPKPPLIVLQLQQLIRG